MCHFPASNSYTSCPEHQKEPFTASKEETGFHPPNAELEVLKKKCKALKKKAKIMKVATLLTAFALTILFATGVGLTASFLGNSGIDIAALGSGSTGGLISGALVGLGLSYAAYRAIKKINKNCTESIKKVVQRQQNTSPVYTGL